MKKRYKIIINKKEYIVEVEELKENVFEKTKREIKIKDKFIDERRKQKNNLKEEKTISAPMPAKIIKINYKKGQRVKKGDQLIILEAMKMENDILSPLDGVIKEIYIYEGKNVLSEEKLLEFE